jgi:hypothetical protein
MKRKEAKKWVGLVRKNMRNLSETDIATVYSMALRSEQIFVWETGAPTVCAEGGTERGEGAS